MTWSLSIPASTPQGVPVKPKRNIAVFGCGPSGLAVAAAAIKAGFGVEFFSQRKQPSHLYGCQYLHAPIPGYESASKTHVSYRLTGTPEQYRAKVYGDDWRSETALPSVRLPVLACTHSWL